MKNYRLIKESHMTLINNIKNQEAYNFEIKNINAINSIFGVNSIVIKLKNGNPQQFMKSITSLYNYKAKFNKEFNIITLTKLL